MKAFLVLSDSGPRIIEAECCGRSEHQLVFQSGKTVVETVEGAAYWHPFDSRTQAESALQEIQNVG